MKRVMVCLLGIVLAMPSSSRAATANRPVGLAPDWYTPAVAAEIMQAGARGVPALRAVFPDSSLAFLGIRPGQLIIIDDGQTTSLCTSNFVFSTGTTTKNYFIGTAGHCGKVGANVVMLYLPKGAVRIGKIVKSTGDPGDNVAATDFALISVDPALYGDISPSMAYTGGPTGAFTGGGTQPILHAGWGLVAGTGGTPRAGIAYAWNLGSEYRFEGVVTPGDSGSGAIVLGGLAAGNVMHLALDSRAAPPVWNGGTTIRAILAYLGSSYRLATCGNATPWPLFGCPPA